MLLKRKILPIINLRYTNSIFKYTPKILELRNLLVRFIQSKDNVMLKLIIIHLGLKKT